MSNIWIDHEKCNLCLQCLERCPFGAVQIVENRMEISDKCRMCGICVKICPEGAISQEKIEKKTDLSAYSGILVLAEIAEGRIHPVTFELLGAARELSKACPQRVCCLVLGDDVSMADEVMEYGADEVYTAKSLQLAGFRADAYADAACYAIEQIRPSVVLVGATTRGRSLAPCIAARMKTGLTADCTQLEMKPNGDLVQIRPAFGGNIMAQIVTTRTRPQFATVRYKVMSAPQKAAPHGRLIQMEIPQEEIHSGIRILHIEKTPPAVNISECEVLVAAGRGVREKGDLLMLEELAALLGGQLCGTRPLVEMGWLPADRQVGLSGRTVKPKFIVTCGVSGAVQFTAAMDGADTIVSINQDKDAPIFRVANYALVGDLYQIIPQWIERLKEERGK